MMRAFVYGLTLASLALVLPVIFITLSNLQSDAFDQIKVKDLRYLSMVSMVVSIFKYLFDILN